MSAAGGKLLSNVRNARAALRGEAPGEFKVHVPESVDVKAIRRDLGLSQKAFALRYGFSTSTVRNWEQGTRRPEGPARVLLTVIAKEPEAVDRALAQS